METIFSKEFFLGIIEMKLYYRFIWRKKSILSVYDIHKLNMPLDIGHLQLLFTVLSISEAMVCRQYRGNIEVDNSVTIQAPSDNLLAASLLTCVSLCDNGCQCISTTLRQRCADFTVRVVPILWQCPRKIGYHIQFLKYNHQVCIVNFKYKYCCIEINNFLLF